MAEESELKYMVPAAQADALCAYLNSCTNTQETVYLSNVYFDNANLDLRKHRIGCRVRRWQSGGQEHSEQTVKLAGTVKDGLHQRPEFNRPQGSDEKPDLTAFPADIWPQNLDISVINEALDKQFEVDFKRAKWVIGWPRSTAENRIEVAFDQGVILAGDAQEEIFEVEAELLDGEVAALLEFGAELASRFELTPFDKSKAQRGFELRDNS
ncbi:inorganic triphosphatase [Aliidiomarina sp. Khilg15.8]